MGGRGDDLLFVSRLRCGDFTQKRFQDACCRRNHKSNSRGHHAAPSKTGRHRRRIGCQLEWITICFFKPCCIRWNRHRWPEVGAGCQEPCRRDNAPGSFPAFARKPPSRPIPSFATAQQIPDKCSIRPATDRGRTIATVWSPKSAARDWRQFPHKFAEPTPVHHVSGTAIPRNYIEFSGIPESVSRHGGKSGGGRSLPRTGLLLFPVIG